MRVDRLHPQWNYLLLTCSGCGAFWCLNSTYDELAGNFL